MQLQTQINDQGMLIVQVPPSLQGKTVIVSITPVRPTENTETVLAWQQIRQTLRRTNELNLPRKSHDEIIADLRNFREAL